MTSLFMYDESLAKEEDEKNKCSEQEEWRKNTWRKLKVGMSLSVWDSGKEGGGRWRVALG